MSSYDGSIRINTKLDTNGFNNGVKSMVSGLTSLTGNVKSLMSVLGIGFSVVGLVKLGKEAINVASDIEEVQNVVDTAFGDMSYKIENFSKTCIEKFGLSKLSAKEMASTFMAMGTGLGQAMGLGSDMAVEMTGRMADIASFYNKTTDEIKTIGKAVYSGETEPLKALGVIMTETELNAYALANGFGKAYKELDSGTKLLVRQKFFLEKTNLAAGDFEKTSNSWANQTRILSERFKELLSILGAGLIQVLTPALQFLNSILSMLIKVATAIGSVLSSLFGLEKVSTSGSGGGIAGTADDAKDLSNNMKDVETNAKKARSQLASFDDLNVRQDDSSGSSGGGADFGVDITSEYEKQGGLLEEAEDKFAGIVENLKQVVDYAKMLAELFKEGFMEGLGDTFNDRLEDIKESLKGIGESLIEIFTDEGVVNAFDTMLQKLAFNAGRVAGSMVSVGVTIAQNILGGIDQYLEENKEFLINKFTSIFEGIGNLSDTIGEITVTFASIFEVFGGENAQQVTANLIGIFVNPLLEIADLALNIASDIGSNLLKPFQDNKEGITTALDGILEVLAKFTGTAKKSVDDTIKKIDELYNQHFKPLVDMVGNSLSKLTEVFLTFWNNNVKPILDEWTVLWEELFEGSIQPTIDHFLEALGEIMDNSARLLEEYIVPIFSFIIEEFGPLIMEIIDRIYKATIESIKNIMTFIDGIIEILKGLILFIQGVLWLDWESAWKGMAAVMEGFKLVVKSIVNEVIAMVERMVNAVIRAINKVIEMLNSLSFDIPSWVPEFGGKSFGINIPTLGEVSLPRLANGSVIRGGNPFMAILGDQPSGQTNIEAPLNTIVEAMERALDRDGRTQDININFTGSLSELARILKPEIDNEAFRIGESFA